MADMFPPTAVSGLVHFDLPLVFRCAVELAEAAAAITQSDWGDVPVNISDPDSPHFERWWERHRRLRRIEEESERLKRSLGAIGPLGFNDGDENDEPKWESYDHQFNNSGHDRMVRLALNKIATAAIDLSGFATWREWQWTMRETGLRLLSWGLAQLWEGMSANDRSAVRDRLSRARIATGWSNEPTSDPPTYDGPNEIPLPDQYRLVTKYVSCYRDYMNDVQKANGLRQQAGQDKFLRRATIEQYAVMAERAGKALDRITKRDFDTPNEWGDLYLEAFGPLACLRRSTEIRPFNVWPDSAMENRSTISKSAELLLAALGGTADANTKLNPADIEAALAAFNGAVERLQEGDNRKFIDRLLAGPADADLSARDLALLEAHLQQPVSFATIQQEKQATGHSPTEAAHNKLKLIRDFNRRLESGKASTSTEPAPAVVAESNPKRSTERGEGRAKLIAELTRHHKYSDGSCLNLEPIGNNELAKAAGVSPSTASSFFNEKFDGHTKYKALCRDSGKLIAALKLLNNEFAPHDLYGRRPAGEDDRDDE